MAHLVIFGASGISGWAVAKEALSYPPNSTFSQVTALTNRPLSKENSALPDDDRLELISGVDLLQGAERVAEALKAKLQHAETISHVVYAAYNQSGNGPEDHRDKNVQLLRNAIEGVLLVTNHLQSVVLQTGGIGYGLSYPDKVEIRPPLKETYPRIPKPEHDHIFYYFQYDALKELAKGSSWTFTEVRPDVIVGFVPGTNAMNCAQGLAFYLSLYRAVHGQGASVAFPGSQGGWTCKHTDTSQDILAKFEIYALLNPNKCGDGNAFNVADGGITTWQEKWPAICAYFDLKGEGPNDAISPQQFFEQNRQTWEDLVQSHGLKPGRIETYGWGFLHFVTDSFNFDRQYDLTAYRSTGFEERIDTVAGYKLAFDRMRKAKTIP